jgi:rhodanese-related sulfurtransferase
MTDQPFSEVAARAVADTGAVILDVRRDDEWAQGHADRAVHWDIAKLQAGELPDIPKDARVYTYCAAGGRAGQAKSILEQNGWTSVVNAGGLKDWQAAGGAISQ